MNKLPKILTIVGPTSSGKTSLSIKLAKEFSGEVISADSRQVYQGIDLLSGKVTAEEMGDIPHHLLDIVEPTHIYTADDFVADATKAAAEIQSRNNLPIVAGGTFFYIDTLLGKQTLPKVEPNLPLRAELETVSTEDLYTKLKAIDPNRAASIDQHNRRRLIRALEIIDAIGLVPAPTQQLGYDVFSIGINKPTEVLHQNIKRRIMERLEAGMIKEAKNLIDNGVSHERMEDLGLECRYISRYLRGLLAYDEMVSELETKIRQFAKRQMTWLKRDKEIHWLELQESKQHQEIVAEIVSWLEK